MKSKIALVLVSVGLIAASCNSNVSTDTTTPPPPPVVVTPPAATPPAVTPPPAVVSTGEVMINMTSAGFEPATVTVKKGTKVTWVNKDTVPRWPASAPHPTHTDLPGFDSLKGIAVNANYSFTFSQTGNWRFHDHLIPTKFGSVTVVE